MQVAECQDHLGDKYIGAGCSNQMQLAQGHHLNANLALVLPAFGCCIPLLYTCAQDGLDTVQLALVVFFLPYIYIYIYIYILHT